MAIVVEFDAAVAMLRFSGGLVEHLVLGDAVVVVGRAGSEPFVAHDPLLSNGASRLVDTFGLTGWAGLLHLLDTDGPGEIIRRVREAEARGGVATDDATIVFRR